MKKRFLFVLGWTEEDLVDLQRIGFAAEFDHIYVFDNDLRKQRSAGEIFGASDRLTFIFRPMHYGRFAVRMAGSGELHFAVPPPRTIPCELFEQTLADVRERGLDVHLYRPFLAPRMSPDAPFVVASAAHADQGRWLEQLLRSLSDFHYLTELYDLGELGAGRVKTANTARGAGSTLIPDLLLHCMDLHRKPVLYLEPGVVVLKSLGDPATECDIAVPALVRTSNESHTQASGPFYFRDTPSARRILEQWRELCARGGSERESLYQVLGFAECKNDGRELTVVDGCRVKLLAAENYHYLYRRNDPLTTSPTVIHFAGRWENLINFESNRLKRHEAALAHERAKIALLEVRLARLEKLIAAAGVVAGPHHH